MKKALSSYADAQLVLLQDADKRHRRAPSGVLLQDAGTRHRSASGFLISISPNDILYTAFLKLFFCEHQFFDVFQLIVCDGEV